MDVLANLALGFGVAFSLENLLYCLGGVALGTLIGVLPGISPLVAIGMLFPLTFTLPPIPRSCMGSCVFAAPGCRFRSSWTILPRSLTRRISRASASFQFPHKRAAWRCAPRARPCRAVSG